LRAVGHAGRSLSRGPARQTAVPDHLLSLHDHRLEPEKSPAPSIKSSRPARSRPIHPRKKSAPFCVPVPFATTGNGRGGASRASLKPWDGYALDARVVVTWWVQIRTQSLRPITTRSDHQSETGHRTPPKTLAASDRLALPWARKSLCRPRSWSRVLLLGSRGVYTVAWFSF